MAWDDVVVGIPALCRLLERPLRHQCSVESGLGVDDSTTGCRMIIVLVVDELMHVRSHSSYQAKLASAVSHRQP